MPAAKVAKGTTTVRLKAKTHRKLQHLAEETGRSMQVVLDQAIERFEQWYFEKKLEEGYARLKEDPKAWAEFVAERDEWDAVSSDGLGE